ncbi:MAG: hypothetical protein AB7H92_17125 [Microbacteriaceae bacterium]
MWDDPFPVVWNLVALAISLTALVTAVRTSRSEFGGYHNHGKILWIVAIGSAWPGLVGGLYLPMGAVVWFTRPLWQGAFTVRH